MAALSPGVSGGLGLLRGIVPLFERGGKVVYVLPAEAAEPDGGRVVLSMLEALLDELSRRLPPGVRVERVEGDPELAGEAARLLESP